MAADKDRAYQSCDRAIQAMNRENVEAFGRLRMAKWDEVHVIRTVTTVYRQSAKRARKRYYSVARDAYILAMLLCDIRREEAEERAKKAVTEIWVDDILERVDPVAQFRFDRETERKAYRLAEQLEVAPDKARIIEKALRDWSKQLGQYAINFTDYAMYKAYADAGISKVVWETQRDERVCGDCHDLGGKVFDVDKIPPKPHWGCRCLVLPILE